MQVTYDLISETIERVDKMMQEAFPDTYKRPRFTKVKISNAHYYWMQIGYNRLTEDYTLRVSRLFENFNHDGRAIVRFTESMIHEFIHTLPGCLNHGTRFKLNCTRFMNMHPEYEITTSSDGGEGYVAEVVKKKYRYEVTCDCCGAKWKFQRMTDFVKNPQFYGCGRCKENYFTVKELQ